MKTIIAGSRGITDTRVVANVIRQAKLEAGIVVSEVVSGGARGVDTIGAELAIKYNMPLRIFPADWNRLGRRAGIVRNIQMAEYADALIAVWDGHSVGTGHMINIAKDRGLKVFVRVV